MDAVTEFVYRDLEARYLQRARLNLRIWEIRYDPVVLRAMTPRGVNTDDMARRVFAQRWNARQRGAAHV